MCDWVASDVRLGGGEVQLDVEVDVRIMSLRQERSAEGKAIISAVLHAQDHAIHVEIGIVQLGEGVGELLDQLQDSLRRVQLGKVSGRDGGDLVFGVGAVAARFGGELGQHFEDLPFHRRIDVQQSTAEDLELGGPTLFPHVEFGLVELDLVLVLPLFGEHVEGVHEGSDQPDDGDDPQRAGDDDRAVVELVDEFVAGLPAIRPVGHESEHGEQRDDDQVDHEHLHVSGPIHKAGLKEPRTKKYNIQQAVCQ